MTITVISALSGHFFGASALAFNEQAYQSWPASVREAVNAAALEATALQHQLAAAEDADDTRQARLQQIDEK